MAALKPGRPAKLQVACHGCRCVCSPQEGDWFQISGSKWQQAFLCKACERKSSQTDYQRTTPTRF